VPRALEREASLYSNLELDRPTAGGSFTGFPHPFFFSTHGEACFRPLGSSTRGLNWDLLLWRASHAPTRRHFSSSQWKCPESYVLSSSSHPLGRFAACVSRMFKLKVMFAVFFCGSQSSLFPSNNPVVIPKFFVDEGPRSRVLGTVRKVLRWLTGCQRSKWPPSYVRRRPFFLGIPPF